MTVDSQQDSIIFMDPILKNILSEVLEIEENKLDHNTQLNDENWTSISIISYMDEVDQKFDIQLDGDELENILDVGSLERYTFSKK